MKNIELIICDLDGTLVDSEKIYNQGWIKVLKKYGHHVSEPQLKVMQGKSKAYNDKFIKSFLGSDKLVEEARKLREDYYFDSLDNNEIKLMPGALELLQSSYENGKILAVATSSYKNRGMATLEKLGVSKYFSHQVFGDQVENSKPHPEAYKKVLDLANINAERAVAIEDSHSGLQAALGADLPVYFVPESRVMIENNHNRIHLCSNLYEVKRDLLE